MRILEMRISLFSQNLGEAKKAVFDLSEFFENKSTKTPDLYVEFSQEDGRKVNGKSLIEPAILSKYNYDLLAQESLNGKTQASQNIVSTVFSKLGLGATVLNTGKITIAPQPDQLGHLKYFGSAVASTLHLGKGYTKGLVYIKIKIGKTYLLFLNMHLPVMTAPKNGPPHDPTLGFEYRRTSFEYLLSEIIKLKLIDSTTTVLIGGDLNFRQDAAGLDQLNVLLEAKKGYKTKLGRTLRELEFPEGSKKRITCKFRNPLSRCRTRNMPPQGFNRKFIRKTQKECGDDLRTPSRCDRFLILSDTEIKVAYHQSEYVQRESDHNAILATIDIKERPIRDKA